MSFSSGRYLEFPPPGFSLRWYDAFFNSPEWRESLAVSFQVAIMATIMSMVLGLPAAFALVRSSVPFKSLIMAFFVLPIVFPVIVSAVAVYYVYAPLHLVGTRLGLAFAHTILALPVVILPTMAAIRRFDKHLEWQALSLGASRPTVFRTVTLPILLPTFLTVSLFAFITSFDEVIFAIFLSSGDVVTLPKRIWEGLRFEIQPTVAVVSTILLVLSISVMSISTLIWARLSRTRERRPERQRP